jgi:hypothetical protein
MLSRPDLRCQTNPVRIRVLHYATNKSPRNLRPQHTERGSSSTNATPNGRSQNGHADDQSLPHSGQCFRIFRTPSSDSPLIRRSRMKRHPGFVQIKWLSIFEPPPRRHFRGGTISQLSRNDCSILNTPQFRCAPDQKCLAHDHDMTFIGRLSDVRCCGGAVLYYCTQEEALTASREPKPGCD